MEVTEGRVTVDVPEQPGDTHTDAVFYNPDQELNRDVTIAALRAFEDKEPRAQSYLDATSASGIRGVRAAADGWDVTLTDVDASAIPLAKSNLARNTLTGEVLNRDANALLHETDRVFDVVDIDPFGSPIPFADAALSQTRNVVAMTATDTAPLCGAHFESGKRRYSAVPRNTEYHPEMGLRILLSALARTAVRYDRGISPLLSHVSDHYVRTYLELQHGASDANRSLEELGYVYHCPECLHRDIEPGLLANPTVACQNCHSQQVVTAGPVWIGPTHDKAFVATTLEHLDDSLGTAERAGRLLGRIEGELVVPMHYDQHRLYKKWNEPAIAMDDFLEKLHKAGFEATRTHYGGTTFKTTATVSEIASAVR